MSIILRCNLPRLSLTPHLSTSTLSEIVGRNSGNLAFGYAASLLLDSVPNTGFFDNIHPGESIGVYACSNQLASYYDPIPFTEFMQRAPDNWRALLLGLGAQGLMTSLCDSVENITLNNKQLAWLTAIRERSVKGHPNISVRGNFTYRVLQKYGYDDIAMVTGCPSFLLSPNKNLGKAIAEKFSAIDNNPLIDGALGNPWDNQHRLFEQQLLRIVIQSGGVSHVQMEDAHMALARNDAIEIDELTRLRDQLSPETDIRDMRNFGRRHLRVWWDVPGWMEHLRHVDFVIGTRIHGVALALQAGTPGVCVVWDSRTLELCRAMNIPHVSIYDEKLLSGQFTFEYFKSAFSQQFDASAFDALRRTRAIQFTQLFNANGVNYSQHLTDLAAA